MIFIFFRHADYNQLENVPSAHQPFALNEEGIKQAEQGAAMLSQLLSDNNWHCQPVIHSSRMLRAWQTADILRQHITQDMFIETFDALAERSMGCLANLTVQQINQVIADDPRIENVPADWKRNSKFCLPYQGAESLMMAGERVAEHIDNQMQKLKQQKMHETQVQLFVGHGAAFRHAAYHLGILAFDDIAKLSMYHAQPLAFSTDDNGYRHIAGDWKVREHAERPD